MEQDNSMIFRVICNDPAYLEEVLVWYNDTYGTNFKIYRIIYDEINFAEIRASKFETQDVFGIGYQFGVKEQTLREKGEIDW